MFGYTRKARNAQIHCVFLTVVLLQLLLCANDIERNPGPDPDMETLLQRLFTQQEVKFQTLVSNSKGDFSHWKTNSVQKWTVRLVLSRTKCKFSRPNSKIRRNYYDMFQEAQTSLALMALEEKFHRPQQC